jgi:hypothetical protein
MISEHVLVVADAAFAASDAKCRLGSQYFRRWEEVGRGRWVGANEGELFSP